MDGRMDAGEDSIRRIGRRLARRHGELCAQPHGTCIVLSGSQEDDPSSIDPFHATKQKQRGALSSLLHVTFDIGNQDSNPHRHRLPKYSRMSVSQITIVFLSKSQVKNCVPANCKVVASLPNASPTCGPPNSMSFDSVN